MTYVEMIRKNVSSLDNVELVRQLRLYCGKFILTRLVEDYEIVLILNSEIHRRLNEK